MRTVDRSDLIGKKIGRLLVVSVSHAVDESTPKQNRVVVFYNCDCQFCKQKSVVCREYLKMHQLRESGRVCYLCRNVKDATGDRYGKLVWLSFVTDISKYGKRGGNYSLYKCDCGKEHVARTDGVKKGSVNSCGCVRERNRRLNPAQQRHVLYSTWKSMNNRCSPKCPKKMWHNYYGRGIRVCKRWMPTKHRRTMDGFHNFVADMGERPSELYSLDRIDNSGNYEPGNCRWATHQEQMANKRGMRALNNFSDSELVAEVKRRKLKVP